MKTAIIVMSDPKNGSEEALGRVFNALALAAECQQEGFGEARLPLTTLSEFPEPPLSVEACGVPLKKDHALAGTSGLLSLRRYVNEGWNTVVF